MHSVWFYLKWPNHGSRSQHTSDFIIELMTDGEVRKSSWQLDSVLYLDLGDGYHKHGFPRWLSGKESACQYRRCKRHRFDP